MRTVALLLLTVALPLQANGFLDFIKSKANDYLNQVAPQPKTITYGSALTADELAPFDPSYEMVRVVEPVFNSALFVLQAGQQHSETVMLVHGVGENGAQDWLTTIPELAKRYHVIAIDLPGFARSSGGRFRYSPENYAKVVHWVQQTFAKGKMSLVGHSMGGGVSLYYAATYPETVNTLILVDAAGILDRTAFVKHLSTLPDLESLPPNVSRFVADFRSFSTKLVEHTGLLFDPTELLNNNKHLRNWLLDGHTNINAGLALVEQDFALLNYARVPPTHMIWGAEDRVAPLRTGRALLHVLPERELHAITNAGHVPMVSHPVQFGQLLLSSLQRKPAQAFKLTPKANKRVGICKNDDQPNFSGYYQKIELNNCRMAQFQGVKVEQLIARNSLLEVNDSTLGKDGTKLELVSTTLNATNSEIYGTLQTRNSNIDLAGVTLHSMGTVFQAQADTIVVLSLTRLDSRYYSGQVNATLRFAEGTLEQALHAKRSPNDSKI